MSWWGGGWEKRFGSGAELCDMPTSPGSDIGTLDTLGSDTLVFRQTLW